MPVKITLGELVGANKGLAVIHTSALPIKMSYNLQKGLKSINEELKQFEEKRNDLIKKYLKEGEKQIEQGSEEFDLYIKDYEELCKVEVDLWFTPINKSDLPETITISPVDLASIIDKFIIDDSEKPKS